MSDDLIVSYADDIQVKIRHNQEIRIELTQQGPQGTEGPEGSITDELQTLHDDVIIARDAANASKAAASSSASSANSFKNAAANSASNAATSAANSLASADNASNSATAASTSAANANQRAIDAAASLALTVAAKTDAETARTEAQTAKTDSETAKTLAEAARDAAILAKDEATTQATAANKSAGNASASATTAVDSATAANASKIAAKTSETNSKTSAIEAKASETTSGTANTAAQNAKTASEAAKTAAETARNLAQTAKTGADTAKVQSEAARDLAQTAKTDANTAKTDAELARDAAAVYAAASAASAAEAATFDPSSYPLKSNNGSDFADPAAVRANIGAQIALPAVAQSVSEAGVSTALANWSSLRVRQNVAAYAPAKIHTHIASDIVGLQAMFDAKANLASPVLTGTPTAPTATTGDSSLQIANTAFVRQAIDALIAGAPGALDTLQELAEALGDDPNFAATITAALADKSALGHTHTMAEIVDLASAIALLAPKSSPALTGSPTAPTQATADNSTKLATTAHVKAAIAAAGLAVNGHTHSVADVTGLPAALADKSDKNHTHLAADVSDLPDLLADKAPLASPALTGAPTAPTQAAGNNSTRIATTAFVNTELANGLSSKANTEHTHEVAGVTGLQDVLDLKAPLASPALSGIPTAPTADAGTNTAQLATTAFVAALASTKFDKPIGAAEQIMLGNGLTSDSIPVTALGLTYNGTSEIAVPVTDGMWLYLTDGTNYGLKMLKDLPASEAVQTAIDTLNTNMTIGGDNISALERTKLTGDWINGIGLASDAVDYPYMKRTSTDELVRLATHAQVIAKINISGGANLGGFTSTIVNDGNFGGGVYQPTVSGSNFRLISTSGQFEFRAPAGDVYTMIVKIGIGGGAGAITMTGFTKIVGDDFTTKSGDHFLVYITKIYDVVVANIVGLQ